MSKEKDKTTPRPQAAPSAVKPKKGGVPQKKASPAVAAASDQKSLTAGEGKQEREGKQVLPKKEKTTTKSSAHSSGKVTPKGQDTLKRENFTSSASTPRSGKAAPREPISSQKPPSSAEKKSRPPSGDSDSPQTSTQQPLASENQDSPPAPISQKPPPPEKQTAPPPMKESSQKKSVTPKNKESFSKEEVKLAGLYAFKEAMSGLYDGQGRFIPVTFLSVPPWYVSQVKTPEKEGYGSVQIACGPQKNRRVSKALKVHLKPAGFKEGARYVREIRQKSLPGGVKVGMRLSIHSLKKGDVIKLSSVSKGHGFSGVVKRWSFSGGPASHGSKTHRATGSVGNRTEPARVMPGKKMPGHYGCENTTLRNVQVVDVLDKEQMIIVRGGVPGAKNSLVFLARQDSHLRT